MKSPTPPLLLVCALTLAIGPGSAATQSGAAVTERQSGAQVENAPTRSNEESLWQAAEAGELQRLLDLLADGTAIDAPNEGGNTALHLAAFRGRLPVVAALLNAGADVNLKDKGGFAPLDWAAANGFDAIAAQLLNAGAKIDSRDLLGNTALSWAAANGHLDVMETLLARGADLASANADGDTPLHLAASNGELEACALLVDRGAPLESKNNEQKTALQLAAAEYYSDIVELLLVSSDGGVPAPLPLDSRPAARAGPATAVGRWTRKSRVLEDIRRHGGVVIGYRQAAVPFSYLGPDGTPMGYSIDLCRQLVSAIREALGTDDLPVKWLPVSSQTRLDAIDSGEVQLDCGVTTHTLGRRELAEFSHTIFVTGTQLLVKRGSGIRSIGDLDGRTVAVLPATTNAEAVAKGAAGVGVEIQTLPVPDHPAGFRALAEGKADAQAADHILLHALLYHAKQPEDFLIVGDFLSFDPYALGLPRNDSAYKLLIDRTLSRLFRTGAIEKLYGKWFDPLKVPMPELLAAAFRLQALPE